jgi:hypothetical protein
MLANYALMPILGYPAIMYGGILVFILLLIVAIGGLGTVKGWFKMPVKVHSCIAFVAIILALIHAILGMSIFIGF